jgi:hypothetical protein
MPHLRWLATAALALACAGAPPPEEPIAGLPADARYAVVEVALAPEAASGLDDRASAELLRQVRQSARDWLEQGGRLAADGECSLLVSIESVHVRSAFTAWWFGWIAAPDRISARIQVLRGLDRVASGPVRVESALWGYSWRDPDERRSRLARRLGRRVVEAVAEAPDGR